MSSASYERRQYEIPDVLDHANDEIAARIQFIREDIARECYETTPPPSPWAGRDEVIRRFGLAFKTDAAESTQMVDLAVDQLHDHTKDVDLVARKRMHRTRMVQTRKRIEEYMDKGRDEITYGRDQDTGRMVVVKKKKYRGSDMAAIGRLMQCDGMIAELDGLGEIKEGGATSTVIEELIQRMDGKKIREAAMSIAQRIQNGEVLSLTPEGKVRVEAALRELAGKKPAKQIESKEVVKSEDGEGDDE